MNILYDHQFFPVLRFSGISRYHYELASYLASLPGCDVSLYMGWHISEFEFDTVKKAARRFFGMKRPAFPGSERIFSHINTLGLSLFAGLAHADIYHQTYYSFFLPRFRGKRVVTVHDLIYFLFPQYFQDNDRMRAQTEKSVAAAHGIIAVSEHTKKDLVRILNVPEDRVQVIYEANSLTGAPGAKNPMGGPYILYVGQRFHWKNFITLLRAYAGSPQLNRNYRLVCFGGSEWTPEEKTVLESQDLHSRVMRTRGPDELLATFYSHAAALVYPSLYEGFGLPVLEAMHYGCPVVASTGGSIPEIAGDAALFFDPQNVSMLQQRLLECVDNKEQRQELSRKGREREATFSWKKCADQTYGFYTRLLKR